MTRKIGWHRIAALLLLGAVATAGLAAQRSFVSGLGDDASAAAGCPVAAPCRTLATAVRPSRHRRGSDRARSGAIQRTGHDNQVGDGHDGPGLRAALDVPVK